MLASGNAKRGPGMKVCIMGAGGLGGFFGGWLAASGADVSFIARGANLQAMRADGLTVTSVLGDRHIPVVHTTDDPAEVGPVDVVLFCVKSYDLVPAAQACTPLLGPETAVISVLNGVDATEQIAGILGAEHAVAGSTLVPANIASPGVIAHVGRTVGLSFGEADGSTSPRLARFRDLCLMAGLEAKISPDVAVAVWSKFVLWSASSSVTAATRHAAGGFQSAPAIARLCRDVAAETYAVGRAHGVNLPDDLVDRTIEALMAFAPEVKSSMLVDLERGKRLELETACGTVVRMGEALGIDTPVNRALYAVLLPFADGDATG